MKRSLFFAVILFGLVFGLGPAWGQSQPQECQKSGGDQSTTCDQAGSNVSSAEAAMTNSASQQAGVTIVPNSGIQQTTSNTQVANLKSAINSCQQAMKACQDKCDSLKAQAQKVNPNGASLAQQVTANEKKYCTDSIQPKIDNLTSKEADAEKAANGASNTGQQAMQMPSLPSASSSDPSTSDTGSTAAATTDTATTAATPSTIAMTGGSGQFSTPSTGSTTSQSSSAYQTSSLNPNATTATSTGSTGSTGGGGSSGGSGSSTAATGGIAPASVTGTNSSSAREGASTGIGSLAVDGGGGGAGGSSGGGSGEGGGLDPSEISRIAKQYGLTPASVGTKAPTVSGSTEVAVSDSQGLFKIGDAAINNYCVKKYLSKNCAK